ncbi:hypothetical protein [Staphylococcus gallinarum]|uniref:hypothetical protein n=1 Tax=Staphylococcus gallinarum TaxID=1293 RepID=UPI0030C4B224
MRLESEINKHIVHKLKQERDMYKRNWDKTLKERDTLIDDIAVLRANNKRLERENEKLRNNYTTLTQHIRTKAEANPNEPRYIALVNFIDRLESK